MFYSAKFSKNVSKVLVLPFCLNTDIEEDINQYLKIKVLYYEWEGDNVNFLNLEKKLH